MTACTPARRLARRPAPGFAAPQDWPGQWPDAPPAGQLLWRGARAARRIGCALAWVVLCCPVQALLLLPGQTRGVGRGKVWFARVFWAVFTRLVGLRVRRVGVAPAGGAGRRVVYVANHSSWLDIAVLGGQLEACFVSKDEVARWPGVSLVARLGRTVFVSRTRRATGRERDAMRARLEAGDDLLLFPEGTSSDGARVLPFRSAFFSVAEGADPPLIQPVSVAYDRLAGLPTRRSTRAVFAWYGDMDLARHCWKLTQWGGMRATVLLHPPLDPRDFAGRKELAQAAWERVAGGAAAMRQDREERALHLAAPVA